ncbi:hypothetical protein J6590_096961 [Homalodisca vitripennis]|nr:hypothetical protein J6590_096961 [Homalodisca vitripennis]
MAIGSPLSPIFANICMEEFERKALASAQLKPKIWWSNTGQIYGLENVQTRFISFVGVLLGFDYRTPPIHDLQLQLNLMPLHTRRIINDLLFLRKLINSNIDAPDLPVNLDFRTSRHLRHTHLLARRQYSTQYLFHSTFPCLQLLANNMPDDIDLFCTSEEAFKKKLLDWKALH